MRMSSALPLLSFLLTLVVMIGLHQRSRWRPKSNQWTKRTQANAKSKSMHKNRQFNKIKCLSRLNVDVKAKIMFLPHRRCRSYSLPHAKTAKGLEALLDFCVPYHTKIVIAKPANECGQNGYWVYDQRGCMRQFKPAKNEKELTAFMKRPGIGFSKSRQVGTDDLRLVFLSDTCEVDARHQRLNCGLMRRGQSFTYRLTPNLIPYGPYDRNFASTACRTY